LKNAVQGIHAGIELLSRVLKAPTARSLPPEECIALLRKQLEALQTSMAGLLDELGDREAIHAGTAPPDSAVSTALAPLIERVRRRLHAEPLVSAASIQSAEGISITTHVSLAERIVMCLLLQAADSAAPDGAISVRTGLSEAGATIDIDLSARLDHTIDAMQAADFASAMTQLLRACGGTFGADFRGSGCTFHLTLPAALAVTADTADSTKPIPGRNILIVDHHSDTAQTLAMLLDLEGCSTTALSSREQALAHVRAARPDLVLIDAGLHDAHGIATDIREICGETIMLAAMVNHTGAVDAAVFNLEILKPAEPGDIQRLLPRSAEQRGDHT
jgi:CheY-like chemotaxis protein